MSLAGFGIPSVLLTEQELESRAARVDTLAADCRGSGQKMNFNANWTCRLVVEVESSGDGCGTPLGSNTKLLTSGGLKFTRLNTLNISARNCTSTRSPICVSFTAEKSKSISPGP